MNDIIISFMASYLAGSLSSLKDLFSIGDWEIIKKGVDQSYEKALNKWCGGDVVRDRIAAKSFKSIDQLRDVVNKFDEDREKFLLKTIVDIWVDEFRNKEECVHIIQENKIDILINDKVDKVIDILLRQSPKEVIQLHCRGLKKHEPVSGYIRRFCSSNQREKKRTYYWGVNNERRTLADYVIGLEEPSKNKFVLYGSAQTGKTTELKQLCWELQQSGLFLPVSYEVRTNTQLQREHLPNVQFVGDKEVIVIIDALDEVNGIKYENLLEEIGGYAYDHPEMKMVLSCRSNYRRESQLTLFTELFLEDLSNVDSRIHIENVLGKGEANGLYRFVIDNELFELIRNPFFLNTLIKAYHEDKTRMPRNKADIYRLFIEKSYKGEQEKRSLQFSNKHSFEDSICLLERVALGLSLMNSQSIDLEDMRVCLYNDSNIEECLRYGLIRCENDRFSFEQNAFREWLVANYLSRAGIEKAKQLAMLPNNRIKPDWYNIIMLWVSMYGKDKQEEINAIMRWLKDASLELVIYIDKDMIDQKTRDDVFKWLLLEYKSLGIRMSNIFTHDYENLLKFGQSKETVHFLADEILDSEPGTAYYADLMCLCYFLNWEQCAYENKDLTNTLFQALEKKTKETLIKVRPQDISFIYLENSFFVQQEYLERFFSIIGPSNYYEAIRSMIKLIDLADKVDYYVDYILEKEQFVHNQQEGTTTHIVSRSCVYEALSKIKTIEAIKKVMTHKFYDCHSAYHDEQEEYNNMMRAVLARINVLIKSGFTELADDLEHYCTKMFKEYNAHFYHDKASEELLEMLRSNYLSAGLRERGIQKFYGQINELLGLHNEEAIKLDDIRIAFTMAALWITKEDVKKDFSYLSPNNPNDRSKAGWYCEIPYKEVADYAYELYHTTFPQLSFITKGKERRLQALKDFADYSLFKQIVLELLKDIDEHTSRREYGRKLRDFDEGFNQYAYRFLSLYSHDDLFDVKGIIRDIKNPEIYEAFYMREISKHMEYPNIDLPVTDEMKRRCIECAKNTVVRYCDGEYVYSVEDALRLMMKGYFQIDVSLLPKLLIVGNIKISKRDIGEYYNREYSLFEYICERVDLDILAPLVVEKLKDMIDKKNCTLAYTFANYLVTNHIEDGYRLSLQYALSGLYLSSNILDLLIKEHVKIEEIKAASKGMIDSDRVSCYISLSRNAGEEEWVKLRLEAEFRSFTDYTMKLALQYLVSVGSLEALTYLGVHPDLMKDGDIYRFNYDTPDAVYTLCFLIVYCDENKFERGYILNGILSSLEKIATKSEDALIEVTGFLRQLTKRGARFMYLNRLIISFENKYYSVNQGVGNIVKAMSMVDTKKRLVIDEKNSKPVWREGDGVYISYNWKGHSAHIVDYLCLVLDNEGIPFHRDRNDCKYLDNIKAFMDAIRTGKTVIVVFSKPYMKSMNCMYELSGIVKDSTFKDRILPVVVDNTIREDQFYLELVSYWIKKKLKQEYIVNQLKEKDSSKAEPMEMKLKEINEVCDFLGVIKEYVDWINADNLDALSATRFKIVIDEIYKRRG